MISIQNDIIRQLKKEILPLQGFKQQPANNIINIGFPELEDSFPDSCFPVGAVHEFLSATTEDAAATAGFISGLLGRLMQQSGVCIWVSSLRSVFPPGLKIFGIEPDRLIFIDLKRENDVLSIMEEALKCEKLTAVVGELKEISFIASRRLQLAVEQSRVTGFIIRTQSKNLNTIACVSRWRITSIQSDLEVGMPGVGFPRWNVELLKIRNGKPGSWQVEWSANGFHSIAEDVVSIPLLQRFKTR